MRVTRPKRLHDNHRGISDLVKCGAGGGGDSGWKVAFRRPCLGYTAGLHVRKTGLYYDWRAMVGEGVQDSGRQQQPTSSFYGPGIHVIGRSKKVFFPGVNKGNVHYV